MLAIAVALTGCSHVDRVAARLNPDGSLDFASCDGSRADSLEAVWSYPRAANRTGVVSITPIDGDVEVGDVFHLHAVAPSDNWERVSVQSIAENEAPIFGYFPAEDLERGVWVWNQTGAFIGTVDVEHCELDEDNVR